MQNANLYCLSCWVSLALFMKDIIGTRQMTDNALCTECMHCDVTLWPYWSHRRFGNKCYCRLKIISSHNMNNFLLDPDKIGLSYKAYTVTVDLFCSVNFILHCVSKSEEKLHQLSISLYLFCCLHNNIKQLWNRLQET